jgi:hypothetical protein
MNRSRRGMLRTRTSREHAPINLPAFPHLRGGRRETGEKKGKKRRHEECKRRKGETEWWYKAGNEWERNGMRESPEGESSEVVEAAGERERDGFEDEGWPEHKEQGSKSHERSSSKEALVSGISSSDLALATG